MTFRDRLEHLRAAFIGAPPEEPPKTIARGQEQAFDYDVSLRAITRGTGGVHLTRWQADDIIARRGLRIYRDMLDDEQVSACLDLTRAAITQRSWDFELEDGAKQEVIAAALRFNLTRTLQGTFAQLLGSLLMHRVDGFALVEKVYDATMRGPDNKPWWGLARFALRDPSSIEFEVDAHGNLLAMRQRLGMVQDGVPLDPWRFIHHVHRPEINRYQGRSALRPAFKHYWAKDNIWKFWNMYIERVGGGLIPAELQEGAALTDADRSALEKLMKNLSTASGLIMPRGVKLNLIEPGDNRNFLMAIEQRDMAIAKSLLLPNLLGYSPQGEHGALAQAEKQMEAYWLILNDYADALADTLNEQLFRELVLWNFGPAARAPMFSFGRFTWEQRRDISKAFVELLQGGAVRKTYEDEAWLREMLMVPPREKDENDGQLKQETPAVEEPEMRQPLGVNPLDSASRRLRTSVESSERVARRVDFQGIKDDLYLRIGGDYERSLMRAARLLLEDLAEQVTRAADAEAVKVSSQLAKNLERSIFGWLTAAARYGGDDARQTLERLEAPRLVRSDGGFVSASSVLQYLTDKAFTATKAFTEDMLEAARYVLINGLLGEKAPAQIVEELHRALEKMVPADVEAPTSAHVATLVRTTLTDAFNASRRAVFEDPELKGFVEAYEFSAVLDDRTTPICRELDGKVWPVGHPNWQRYTPALHFNCRSLLVPVVAGDEWKESPDELPGGVAPAPGFHAPGLPDAGLGVGANHG